jgi:hypothetical protein
MTEYKYIGVSISEVLEGLIDITGSHTESEYLIDEIVREYELEYADALKIKKGEKTPEQVAKEREYRRLSQKHSIKLRRNMEAAGRFGPVNTDAHHIVAWWDEGAEIALTILEQVGIHVDDEVNGVYLPSNSKYVPHPDMPNAYAHSKVHTDIYYLNITELLAQERGNKKGVESVLRQIGKELTEGVFPLHELDEGV